MKVSISISDPWDLGEGRQWRPLLGELLRSVQDERGGQALIKLDEPLVKGDATWTYLIASPRSASDEIRELEQGNEVFSGIVGVPENQGESVDPFGAVRDERSELYFIGTVGPSL